MILPAFEWQAFDGTLPGESQAASAPLHIGPARWLLVAPRESWLAQLGAAEHAGRGALTDVTGRWVPIEFATAEVTADLTEHPLSAAAPLDLVLRDRDVAPMWMFDCPVLLVRRNSEVGVLVEASYLHSFRALVATL